MKKEWHESKEVWNIHLSQSEFSEITALLDEEKDMVVEITDLSSEGVGAWLDLVELQSEKARSLILVVNEDKIGLFGDEEIPMAPTYLEALDLLDMERIERELGF
jgi:hypothetical protein